MGQTYSKDLFNGHSYYTMDDEDVLNLKPAPVPPPPPPSPQKDWELYPPIFTTFLMKVRNTRLCVMDTETDANVIYTLCEDLYQSLCLINRTYGSICFMFMSPDRYQQRRGGTLQGYTRYMIDMFQIVKQEFEKNNNVRINRWNTKQNC